jgi:heme a synthase
MAFLGNKLENNLNFTPESKHKRIIAIWLYIGVAMIIIQVLLGGITRLTGSGLSITEWKPIMGALPPLNTAEWQIAFEKYKQIGQFKFINADFNLADFKFIFFWEWLHRNWARVIGLVFFLPFIFFIINKMIKKEMAWQFVIIFCIGALQGLVGWLMVASGLNDDMLFVHYFKLATHFITALLALTVVYWYALYFSKPLLIPTFININSQKKAKYFLITILAILVIQLCYGAFMAGLKAAAAAPTWPTINGSFIPEGLWQKSFFQHPINIHFVHRNVAYLLALIIIIFSIKAKKISTHPYWKITMYVPLAMVILQIALGIASVLYAPHPARNAMGMFEWSAQIHQLVALFLLLSIIHLLFFAFKKQENYA